MKNVFKGSTAEIEVTLVEESGAFHLGDATTQFSVEFYIRGKHAVKTVVYQKDELFMDAENPDKFVAHVPTEEFGTGTICCTITGTYKDNLHEGEELPFVYSLVTPVSVVEKYY